MRLHEQKELNDNLMPMGKETVTNLLNEVADDDDLAYVPGKVGSVKRKRLYDRKVVPCCGCVTHFNSLSTIGVQVADGDSRDT